MKGELIPEIGAGTNTGKRRISNEDSFAVFTNHGTLLIIADGMGGEQAGEIASAMAVEIVKKEFSSATNFNNAQQLLKKSFLSAHHAVLKYAETNINSRGMGTTLIAAWQINNEIIFCWSGDSRAYLFQNNKGLKLITKDHSYVQELVDRREISAEQAFSHPQNNIITQSIGNPQEPPNPDTITISLQEDDIILICSDGLNNMLTDSSIKNIISTNQNSMQQCADKLIASANEAGGRDNITVILVKMKKG